MHKIKWRLIEQHGETQESVSREEGEQRVHTVVEPEYDETQVDEKVELSDIIPDMLLCQEMRRLRNKYADNFLKQAQEEIRLLTQYNYLIKEYIICRKMVLNAIHKTKTSVVDEHKFHMIEELIQDCRQHIKGSELRKKYNLLFQDQKLESILKKIEEKLDESLVPYYWMEKLVKTLDGTIAERRKVVKLLQESMKYQPSKEERLTIQMILNNALYQDYIDSAKKIHIINTEKMMNYFEPVSVEHIQDFQAKIDQMRGYINQCAKESPNNYVFDCHCDASKGCYGLLQQGNNSYFALSGSFDFLNEEIGVYYKFKKNTLDKYESLRENVSAFHGMWDFDATWSRLSLQTKRYPYDGDRGNGIPDEGETFKQAMERLNDPDYVCGVKKDFTCCERKIFEDVSGNGGEVFLFSKYRPCKKCRPAIRKFKYIEPNIRVFYLGENGVEEWIDQGEVNELLLDNEYIRVKEKLRESSLKSLHT